MKLVVTQPFADFKVGDAITKPEDVTTFLESHPGSVVKAADDPTPLPEEPSDAPASDGATDAPSRSTSRRS